MKFAPPRGVFESDFLRLEWQSMDNRQPFYHRNVDVDELSYQIAGPRTLMTDLGTAELVPGDFSRIPRGVAHDSYGRRASHLLFYIPAPVEELLPPVRTTQPTMPPFPGWEPAILNELITECLGGPEHEVATSPIDEQLLLEGAEHQTERIQVLRPDDGPAGTTWLYRSAGVLIGRTQAPAADGREYRRHLDVDEVQYQVAGHRTLVTPRGVLHLEPGDLVRIPLGLAFTSLHAEPSAHLTVVSTSPLPQATDSSKKAEPVTAEDVERLRQDIPTSTTSREKARS